MSGMENLQNEGKPVRDYGTILNEVETAISLGNEKQFIESRLHELNESSKVKDLGIMYSKIHQGFINPNSRIQRSPMVDPFHLDDDSLYEQLFTSVKKFKEADGWKEKDLRSIMPVVIQQTLSDYFGNSHGKSDTESRNQKFYIDHSDVTSEDVSLKDLKGKEIAVCAEKASASQNLVSFLGLESYLIMSDSKLESSKPEFHAFNVWKTKNGFFIYDPTNPRLTIREETNNLESVYPAVYKISEEEFNKVISDGEVSVKHENAYIGNDAKPSVEITERIYSGPEKK